MSRSLRYRFLPRWTLESVREHNVHEIVSGHSNSWEEVSYPIQFIALFAQTLLEWAAALTAKVCSGM